MTNSGLRPEIRGQKVTSGLAMGAAVFFQRVKQGAL